MSDWHFGMDYDMWLYPPVSWWEPDYDYELPEPIEAANIEGTLLVNADDAIEQVRGLQAENAKLRELCADMYRCSDPCNDCPHYNNSNIGFYCGLGIGWKARRMRELGIEVEQ